MSVYELITDGRGKSYYIRYDAVIYSRALGARTPGTHSLHLIEEADHNFTNVNLDFLIFLATANNIPSAKTKL